MIKKYLFLFILFFFFKDLFSQENLSLIFTGDIMGHEAQILSAKKRRNNYDYNTCFQYVKPLIESVDIAIGNLEVTLPGHKPYTGFMALPIFRSPDAYADALKNAGFDVLFNANNHANDGMRKGVKHTIDKLDAINMLHSGTFKNSIERKEKYPLMVEKKGIKLAFLNYTFIGTNGIRTIKPSVVNKLDTNQIKMDIAQAKVNKADFIIAVLHWGEEHHLDYSETQKAESDFLIINGVNMIVGMHPHVVQAIEYQQTNDSKVLVAYSLGNFISNHNMPNADGGIMLKINLTKINGIVEITKSGYLPVWRYIEKAKKKSYTVLPISDFEKNPQKFPALDSNSIMLLQSYAKSVRTRLKFDEWKD